MLCDKQSNKNKIIHNQTICQTLSYYKGAVNSEGEVYRYLSNNMELQ